MKEKNTAAPDNGVTPSQTVGPYLHLGFDELNTSEIAPAGVSGDRYSVQGRVLDADGQPVPDGVIEIWQANAHGRYAHPADTRDLPLEAGFVGFGRIPTDFRGAFQFTTIKPGRVPGANGQLQAPHLMVSVFARGLLKRLVTRMYFPGDDHAADPVLQCVPEARRYTLIPGTLLGSHRLLDWNVMLGGINETVFFDL